MEEEKKTFETGGPLETKIFNLEGRYQQINKQNKILNEEKEDNKERTQMCYSNIMCLITCNDFPVFHLFHKCLLNTLPCLGMALFALDEGPDVKEVDGDK